ncbi:MAG: DnaD domain protein [Clostridia bacterium]|nr:DnaD domain protein [Clostridia bacterium]
MAYKINLSAFSSSFPFPKDVVDKHLKLVSVCQLKVLLFVMRNSAQEIEQKKIAKELSLPESEVEDALLYWSQCGLLEADKPVTLPTSEKAPATAKEQKPSRSDVAKRGNEDDKIRLLLGEAQLKFGRSLKTNEMITLVWLYDDKGMDISVILLLLQYAVSEEKCNIGFIEKTAIKWLNSGVETVADAEREIAKSIKNRLAWSVVETAFGIEKRKPSEKECEFSRLWVEEWNMSPDMLRLAYDACVDAKAKLSFPYISKILEGWHEKGYKSAKDIKNTENKEKTKKKNKNDYATYNLDKFEELLNSKN